MQRSGWCLGICLLLLACSRGGSEREEASKDDSLVPFGPMDRDSISKKLEGRWNVGEVEWTFAGDKVSRKQGASTIEGQLIIRNPVSFGLQQDNGTTSYFKFAFNGKDLFLGLGQAGFKSEGRIVALLLEGVLVKDPKGCVFYREKFNKLEKKAVPIECTITMKEEMEVIKALVPDRFNENTTREKILTIIGEAVIDSQMLGNKAQRMEAQRQQG